MGEIITSHVHIFLIVIVYVYKDTVCESIEGNSVTPISENITSDEHLRTVTTTQDTRGTTLENTSLLGEALVAYLESIRNYDSLPDADVTKAFIMSFPSNFQRQVIASQLSYCPFVPLCSYSLNVTDQSTIAPCCQPCSCLPNCTEYNTCCPDIVTIASDHDDSVADNMTKTCIPLHINMYLTPPIFTDAVFGIADCPAASTYAATGKCKQRYDNSDITMIDIYPVRHVQTGLIFRNMHCALCNDLKTREFEYLEAEFECLKRIPTNGILTDYEFIRFFMDEGCDIRFFTDHVLEHCVGSISRCNHSIGWTQHGRYYENACTMYTSVVEKDSIVFQNVFCALCNGYTDITYACDGEYNAPAFPFSFSGLLSFSRPDNEDKPFSSRHCGAGFIFHRDEDECIEAHCSPVRRLVGNECKTVWDTVKLFDYDVMLRLTPSVPFNTVEIMDEIYFVFHVVTTSPDIPFARDPSKLSICGFDFMLKTKTLCSDIDSKDKEIDYLLLKLFLRLNFDHHPEEIVSKLHSKIDLDFSGACGFENETLNVQVTSGFEQDFEQGFPAFAPPTKEFCSSIDDKVMIPLNPSFDTEYCEYFETHESLSSYLTCPTIQISKDISPWIINDDGVLFAKSGHVFDHSQFYITYVNEPVLFLCKDRYFELSARSLITEWTLSTEHIVSITFVSLSIVFLIVTLTVFYLLTPLRTLPGKNNMALVSALLSAQTFYLVGSFARLEQGSVSCKAVGILIHFSWLLVVFWMNVCTYHMFHVLTKTNAMPRHSSNKRYLAYHLYCIVCSGVFVGINFLVSYVTSDYNDIGYGTNSCYISSHYMLMYTFAIPLALSMVSNIVMFLVVIVSIRKASAIQKHVQNERNDIAVFARLSTLTGATWLFGFIYTWTNIVAFSYVFIVLNAGQGMFLFLSFICTRRVIRIALQKYSASSSANGSSSRRTAMTSVK